MSGPTEVDERMCIKWSYISALEKVKQLPQRPSAAEISGRNFTAWRRAPNNDWYLVVSSGVGVGSVAVTFSHDFTSESSAGR